MVQHLTRKTEWERVFDIQVALRIIKHISSGIYRRPAGAIKELVSNSFDSQATLVTIETGSPEFRSISVKDNGLGMTRENVEKSFHNIGVSQKYSSPEDYAGENPRPLVGKFGIGLLSCAHASRDIRINTFTDKNKPGLEIELDLNPYFEYVNQVRPLDEFEFGTIKYRDLENVNHIRGTEIILDKVPDREAFYNVISSPGDSFVSWPDRGTLEASPGSAMENFVLGIGKAGLLSIERLPGREQILWDLGIMCPVDYLDDGPVADEYLTEESRPFISELKAKVRAANFSLYYDGVQVRKPILLPTPKKAKSAVDNYDPDLGQDVRVWTRRFTPRASSGVTVSAAAYLVYQPNRVTPGELRGLYPRVSGVGVGQYDNTFFRGIKAENPIFRVSASGELFISEGLDDALDLDRAGFMELDPEFRALQSQVFDWLASEDEQHPGVSRQAKRTSSARSKRRRKIKSELKKDERQRKTSKLARKAGVPYQAKYSESDSEVKDSITAQGQDRRRPRVDYVHVSAYPSGPKPLVTIDARAEAISLAEALKDPAIAAVIIAAHHVMGDSKEGARLRKLFADALAKLL